MKSYIYLASPYSDLDAEVREQRYEAVLKATSDLMQKGFHIFSPIVHCHPIAVRFGLPGDYDYWKDYDVMMLKSASLFMIYCVEGWNNSKGLAYERDLAKLYQIPEVLYVPPEAL